MSTNKILEMMRENSEKTGNICKQVGKSIAMIEFTINWLENPKDIILPKEKLIELLRNVLKELKINY